MPKRRDPALLLPLLLWALSALLPSPSAWAGSLLGGGAPRNSTLLFDSAAHGSGLRNCSCASEIRDCDEALANLLCSCRTVPRSALTPAGLHTQGGLTVWVRDPWVLQELLNGSTVQDLRLSACGSGPMPPQPLALFGLRRLRVHTSAPGAPHPEQALNIPSGPERGRGRDGFGPFLTTETSVSSSSSPLLMSFLDVSLLNGLSSLKAYSISSPVAPTLSQHFPHLPLHHTPLGPQHSCLLTFIY
ncbi:uncharacterized protein C21orf62 homolog [Megalops cyprinoides]|uniref:uncharacterized protein C21orf62 homolog n=1 Tax=Megalops cyprinoides TaxID=118141 RepID=UPI0018652B17|nr:uncharacterized protein C21orf62 homolog [Megalops cyprinoides]